jgi:hypothetical protein
MHRIVWCDNHMPYTPDRPAATGAAAASGGGVVDKSKTDDAVASAIGNKRKSDTALEQLEMDERQAQMKAHALLIKNRLHQEQELLAECVKLEEMKVRSQPPTSKPKVETHTRAARSTCPPRSPVRECCPSEIKKACGRTMEPERRSADCPRSSGWEQLGKNSNVAATTANCTGHRETLLCSPEEKARRELEFVAEVCECAHARACVRHPNLFTGTRVQFVS